MKRPPAKGVEEEEEEVYPKMKRRPARREEEEVALSLSLNHCRRFRLIEWCSSRRLPVMYQKTKLEIAPNRRSCTKT